ncbi:MAG TPA: hypothetical protein VEX68_29695 [Bryobacteraceae bacterium]|nr:hypothetical protein [Bryobacteraceae bacterium]
MINAMIGTMLEDSFENLDRFLGSDDRVGALEFLIEHFRAKKDIRSFFEARLMKKRLELGLPLIQAHPSADIPADLRGPYDQGMIAAARDTGKLALENGDIPLAWPYFRAIGEPGPIIEAIEQAQPGESVDQIINIAFAEGVHPAKGLELILDHHGMCRAITTFGMYAVKNGRVECILLLVRRLHAEVMERLSNAIESQAGSRPSATKIAEVIAGRNWLFGEYDYYVDTSHLMSVLAYSLEVTDRPTLELLHDLCAYGKRLSPMFQTRGQSPFENAFIDYDEYILAVMGDDVDKRLAHFRKKIAESNPEEVGFAPVELLVNLAVRLGRYEEALQVAMEHFGEEDIADLSCPSTLQLCVLANDAERLKTLARSRGDLLSYIAAKS